MNLNRTQPIFRHKPHLMREPIIEGYPFWNARIVDWTWGCAMEGEEGARGSSPLIAYAVWCAQRRFPA